MYMYACLLNTMFEASGYKIRLYYNTLRVRTVSEKTCEIAYI